VENDVMEVKRKQLATVVALIAVNRQSRRVQSTNGSIAQSRRTNNKVMTSNQQQLEECFVDFLRAWGMLNVHKAILGRARARAVAFTAAPLMILGTRPSGL
jgi:hypothetical protein